MIFLINFNEISYTRLLFVWCCSVLFCVMMAASQFCLLLCVIYDRRVEQTEQSRAVECTADRSFSSTILARYIYTSYNYITIIVLPRIYTILILLATIYILQQYTQYLVYVLCTLCLYMSVPSLQMQTVQTLWLWQEQLVRVTESTNMLCAVFKD